MHLTPLEAKDYRQNSGYVYKAGLIPSGCFRIVLIWVFFISIQRRAWKCNSSQLYGSKNIIESENFWSSSQVFSHINKCYLIYLDYLFYIGNFQIFNLIMPYVAPRKYFSTDLEYIIHLMYIKFHFTRPCIFMERLCVKPKALLKASCICRVNLNLLAYMLTYPKNEHFL